MNPKAGATYYYRDRDEPLRLYPDTEGFTTWAVERGTIYIDPSNRLNEGMITCSMQKGKVVILEDDRYFPPQDPLPTREPNLDVPDDGHEMGGQ